MKTIRLLILASSLLFGYKALDNNETKNVFFKDDIEVLSSSSLRNDISPCLKLITSINKEYLKGNYEIGFISMPLDNLRNSNYFTLDNENIKIHHVNNDEFQKDEDANLYFSYLDLDESQITTTFAIRSYIKYEHEIYYAKNITSLNLYRLCEKIEIANSDKESILALASAYKSKNDNGFVFNYDSINDVYEITSFTQDALENSFIPSYYKGKWVKKICSNAFKECNTIKSLTIPYSLTDIEDNAFLNANLTLFTESKEHSSSWSENFNPTYCPIYYNILPSLNHDEYISQENIVKMDKYIRSLMKEGIPAFNQENVSLNRIHYSDALMMGAILNVYEVNHNPYFLNETISYINNFININNKKWKYKPGGGQLDSVPYGDVLLRLYEITGNKAYYELSKTNLSIMNGMERIDTDSRNFFHKSTYVNQVWLDGLFMAMPFYTRYEANFNNHTNYEDIYKQYEFVYNTLRNKENGLYYHGYDHSGKQSWAKQNTTNPNCSLSFWGRGIGWLVTSLVNVLDQFNPSNDVEITYRNFLEKMLKEAMESVYNFVDQETYLFYQVIDKQNEEGNYLETSGSSLICYAALKGSRLGVLSEEFYQKGLKTFNGLISNKLNYSEEKNRYVLKDVNKVAGLGGTPYRDGTFAYYISESIVNDNPKGSGPLIMAYSELIR